MSAQPNRSAWYITLLLLIAVSLGLAISTACAAVHQVPGTTEAKFSVTSDGGGSYTIPLRVAPGTAGLEPRLSLSYSSRAGKSPYGFGWNISGLTSVQRIPKNLSDDGVVRGVLLSAEDALSLDGEKLVAVADTRATAHGEAAFVEYRTRTDSYSRVRAYDWTASGPGRLTAETKAGLILHFGRGANSRVAAKQGAGPIIVWLCDRVEDRFGNFMRYTYRANAATMDFQIAEIAYTGNDRAKLLPYSTLQFEYETLSAPYEIRFLDGEAIQATTRLKRIVSRYGERVVRSYIPNYVADSVPGLTSFYLTSLTESGDEVDTAGYRTGDQTAYKPQQFSYTHSVPQWAQRPWLSDELAGLPNIAKISEGFRPIQAIRDGIKVSAVVFRAAAGGKDIAGAYYFDATKGKWLVLAGKNGKAYTPPVVLADQRGAVSTVAWADVNGDGLDDLIFSGRTPQDDATYLSTDGGWEKAEAAPFRINGGSLASSGVTSTDIRSGGTSVRTLMWHHPSATGVPQRGAAYLDGTAWKSSAYVPPLPLRGDRLGVGIDRTYLIDTNCDGNAELLYLHPNTAGGAVAYEAGTTGWKKLPETAVPDVGRLPSHAAMQIVGTTADKCTRIVAAYGGSGSKRTAWVGTATKWEADTPPPNILFWLKGANGVQVASVGDLNGDGQPDIFAYSANGTARYTYLNRGSAGWELATPYAPPLSLPTRPELRERLVFTVPLQGTSRTLLMYLGSSPNVSLPRIFTHGAGGGWEEIGDYRLPDTLNIAVFNKVDLGVRFVDVNGDGYPDIVWSVRRGVTLDSKAWLFDPASTTKKWVEHPEYALPEALASDDYVDTGTVLADVNGDGLIDLMIAREQPRTVDANGTQWALTSATYINCAKKTVAPCIKGNGVWQKNVLPGLIPTQAFVRDGLGSMGVRAIDVNGDGLTDLVFSRVTLRDLPPPHPPGNPVPPDTGEHPLSPYEQVSITLLNDGGVRWRPAPGYMLPQPLMRQAHCPLQPPDPWAPPSPPLPSPKWCDFFQDDEVYLDQRMIDNRVEFVDINGDRLPDVLFHYRTFVQSEKDGVWEIRPQIVSGALINTGSGWKMTNAFTPPYRIDPGVVAANDPNGQQVFFEDLNADGLPDLLYVRKGASEVFLNKGAGWGTANSYFALPDEAIGGGRGDTGMRLFDLNGDGLLDIVFNRIGGADPRKGAFLNTGTGWVAAPAAFAPPMPFAEDGMGDVGVRPLDVNGDGLVDLIQFFGRQDGSAERAVFVNESGRPGLLDGITDGNGLMTSVAYESYMAYENRARTVSKPRLDCEKAQKTLASLVSQTSCDSAYPIINTLLPGYIVTRFEVGGAGVERRSSSYRYAGYRLDVRAGRSLGFALQEILDEQKERITINRYAQEAGLVGQIVASITTQRTPSGEAELNSTASVWSTSLHPGLVLPDMPSGFVPYYWRGLLSGREHRARDLTGKMLIQQKDELSYDARGNPTVVKTSFPDGSGSVTTSMYHDDEVHWLLGRPVRTRIELFAVGRPTETRLNEFVYDVGSGALVRQTSFAGTAFERIGSFTLDRFGNKLISSILGTGETQARLERNEYDSKGRFPVAAINALGHVTRVEFDEGTGVVLRRIDPNGAVNTLTYDGLQHVTREVSLSGVVTSLRTVFSSMGDKDRYAQVQIKQVGVLPATLNFSDAAGRTRRSVVMRAAESPGISGDCAQVAQYTATPAGAQAVITDSRYDRLGRLVEITVPRFCGANEPVLARRMRFDALDRVVVSVTPDGARSTADYDGLSSTTTDASGNKTVTDKDIRGRVVRVRDAHGGTTAFDYDAAGRTMATTDATGQRTDFTYDLAGNKTSSNDLVGGRWQFEADAAGKLVQQTDPRGRVTRLEYDLLGRLVRRNAGSRVSSWNYDDCPNGIGRLCRAATAGIDSTKNQYDSLGRLQEVTTTVGADGISTVFEFDALNRVVRKTYSTGIVIHNEFDELGNFRAVYLQDGAQTTEVTRATRIDELGRVRSETMGNVVQRTVDFSVDSGKLREIRTTGAGGTLVQQLRLEYDRLGNVVRRSDAPAGIDESYRYDALNRLTDTDAPGGKQVHVSYDALGNIKSKSDVGSYSYCSPDGSARLLLCGIDNAAGTQRFSYDSAGNMTTLGDRTLSFDEDGHVSAIERVSASMIRTDYSEFRYGTDGQMARQETRKVSTKFNVVYLADTEILREEFTPTYFSTPERTRIRHHIVGPGGGVGFYEKTYFHYPFKFASPFSHHLVRDMPERVTALSTSLTYVVKDHLGSLQALLDGKGALIERMAFDAWGQRRDHQDGYKYRNVRTGFTGHEQLDSFELVHMQGRVYSPALGRFLSPDVMVQFPTNTQSFNRYAYVLNNPLRYIDPSGFDLWGDIVDFFEGAAGVVSDVFDAVIGKPIRWAGEQLHKAGVWLEKNWRIVVIIAVAIAAPYALAALGPISAVAVGAITGATVGGLSAALYGGTLDDVLRGAVLGAITGALTGGVAQYYGEAYSVGRVFSEGAVGGLSAQLRGGNFSEGFNFAFAMAALTYANQEMRRDQLNESAQYDKPGEAGHNNLAPTGEYSEGKFGLKDKLGGCRDLLGATEACSGFFGGRQAGPGFIGDSPYAKGSFKDNIVESFAGPHDWMIDKAGGYWPNGFGRRYGSFLRDEALAGVMLVPAAYFASPAFVPAQARDEMRRRCSNAYQWCM